MACSTRKPLLALSTWCCAGGVRMSPVPARQPSKVGLGGVRHRIDRTPSAGSDRTAGVGTGGRPTSRLECERPTSVVRRAESSP